MIYIIVYTKEAVFYTLVGFLQVLLHFPIDGTPLLKDVGKLLHLSPMKRLIATNASIIRMLIRITVSLLRTVESIANSLFYKSI